MKTQEEMPYLIGVSNTCKRWNSWTERIPLLFK